MGRCYYPVADEKTTILFLFVMADVIAQWQMEWPLQGVSVTLLLDVVPMGRWIWVIYLSFSS